MVKNIEAATGELDRLLDHCGSPFFDRSEMANTVVIDWLEEFSAWARDSDASDKQRQRFCERLDHIVQNRLETIKRFPEVSNCLGQIAEYFARDCKIESAKPILKELEDLESKTIRSV